jgi:hypothetical protein
MVEEQATVGAYAARNTVAPIVPTVKAGIPDQSMKTIKPYAQVRDVLECSINVDTCACFLDVDECQASVFFSPCGLYKCNNTEGRFECYG